VWCVLLWAQDWEVFAANCDQQQRESCCGSEAWVSRSSSCESSSSLLSCPLLPCPLLPCPAENAKIPCVGGHPKNIIMLCCDAFGVLPPVAKLTKEQVGGWGWVVGWVGGWRPNVGG
jgi:hypothetical protein